MKRLWPRFRREGFQGKATSTNDFCHYLNFVYKDSDSICDENGNAMFSS